MSSRYRLQMSTALRNAQTKGQRILQALTNEELSDDKPSQFLRRIQRLLGGASDNVARQLFLRKLPLPIRTGLAPFQDRPLTEQAELADQIAALQPTTTINAVSSDISSFASRLERLESPYMNSYNAATNRWMTTAIQKAVAHRRRFLSPSRPDFNVTTDIDFSLFYGDIRKASVIVNATNDNRHQLFPHSQAPKIQPVFITFVSATEPKSAPHPVRGETTPVYDADGRRVTKDSYGVFLIGTGAAVSLLPATGSQKQQAHVASNQPILQAINEIPTFTSAHRDTLAPLDVIASAAASTKHFLNFCLKRVLIYYFVLSYFCVRLHLIIISQFLLRLHFSVTTDIDFSLFYGGVRKTPVIINAASDVIDNVKIKDLVLELDLIERMTKSTSAFSKSGQVYAVKRFMPSARQSGLMKFSISCARLALWQSPNTFDGTFDSESELSVASRTGQICGVKTTLLPYIAAHITEVRLCKYDKERS
ncbi:conserved hypothetical protein [Trichinella spiralis]|uniref:hypothetical protein n=1 Tax=Trichinella spiralis TaxID=6334 RepID=UPI0001EFCC78|nr:conserved hypothetical protein [Trichinella spiralis]